MFPFLLVFKYDRFSNMMLLWVLTIFCKTVVHSDSCQPHYKKKESPHQKWKPWILFADLYAQMIDGKPTRKLTGICFMNTNVLLSQKCTSIQAKYAHVSLQPCRTISASSYQFDCKGVKNEGENIKTNFVVVMNT